MAKTLSSNQWLERQKRDPFVKASKQAGYRSRASFKLKDLHDKYTLFKPGMRVVDLGAAPGGWSQLLSEWVQPKGHIVAIDLLEMAPLPGVTFIQGDFTCDEVYASMINQLGGKGLDWVVSDMAPNMSGNKAIDQPRMMYLLELAHAFAKEHLKRDGGLLVKIFQGEGFDEFVKQLRQDFEKVILKKPEASRKQSREFYIIAKGLK